MSLLGTDFMCAGFTSNGFLLSFQPWFTMGFLALSFSMLIIAVIYFIGRLTDMQNVESYLKMELVETFFTAIILLTIVIGVQLICTFPSDIFLNDKALDILFLDDYHQNPNVFEVVNKYLLFIRSLHSNGMLLFGMAQIVTSITDVNWRSSAGGIGISLNPASGFAHQMSAGNNLITVYMNLYMVHLVLIRVITYSSYAFFNYLLPLGIFFRCFQPTRKFGGSLIGITIAFTLVYPMLLLFNAKMLFEYSGFEGVVVSMAEASSALFGISVAVTALPAALVYGVMGYGIGEVLWDAATSGNNLKTVMNTYLAAISSGTFSPSSGVSFESFSMLFFSIFSNLMKIIGGMIMIDVIFQTINFLIVVAAVKNITQLLGQEMDISMLTRMV